MQQVYIVLGKRLPPEKYLQVKAKDSEAVALHPDAQIRLDALSAICREAPVDLVIFSGGRSAGFGLPSEAHSLCAKFLCSNYGSRCPEIKLEDESLNTIENAEHIKPLVERVQYFVLRVITNGYHAQRAKEVFLAAGLNVEVLVAEDVLANLVHARAIEMDDYKKSLHFRFEQMLEWVRHAVPRKLLMPLSHYLRS